MEIASQTLSQNKDENETSPFDNMPLRRDKEIELKKIEIETIEKFLAQGRQKTDITASERTLLSIALELALRPFQISEKIARRREIPFNMENHKNTFLVSFLESYLELGIPVGRKGRQEDKFVLSSYFSSQHADQQRDIPTHLK